MDELDREAFCVWLQQRADEWVGASCMTDSCPLAVYLFDCTGKRWHVSVLGRVTEDRTEAYRLPGWARAFVAAIDVTAYAPAFSGRQALEMLMES